MHLTLTYPTLPGGRFFTKEGVRGYRFGFNGKEKVDEVYGDANAYDFGARLYDPRLGRWLAVDPLAAKFPDSSPYSFSYNNPIYWIDSDGKEPIKPQVTGVSTLVVIINHFNVNDLTSLRNLFGSNAIGQNTGGINQRYMYSSKWGWVDMKHVSMAAASADKTSAKGTLKRGEATELRQEYGYWPNSGQESKSSAWNYEDLVSNLIGVGFEMYLETDAAQGKSFAENFEYYMKDLGFMDFPEINAAEEFNKLPEEYQTSPPENRTYNPLNAPDSDKRDSETDKMILEFKEEYISDDGGKEDRSKPN